MSYLGENIKKLGFELMRLPQKDGKIDISKKVTNRFTGTYVDVILDNKAHHHEHRNLNDVNKIIDNSLLDDKVKELTIKNNIPLKEMYKLKAIQNK